MKYLHQGPDSCAKICSFECSFENSFEYFSNSFVKEVFRGAFKGALKGAKFLHQNRDPGLQGYVAGDQRGHEII